MQPKLFCQSCTMPIDEAANKGTEKEGTPSKLYCKYCYQNGVFTTPDMTIEKMKSIMTEQMQIMQLPKDVIQKSFEMLPHLKRWQKV
jgi:Putative zinc ribbon domain